MPLRPPLAAFLVACVCHALCATDGFWSFAGHRPEAWSVFGLVGGGFAFVIAMTLGTITLLRLQPEERASVKVALVFLALGPLAFWGLLWPAAIDTICIARGCYSAAAVEYRERMIADVEQSQLAMAVVAWAAAACAAIAMRKSNQGAGSSLQPGH